jgi:hypothetical protein
MHFLLEGKTASVQLGMPDHVERLRRPPLRQGAAHDVCAKQKGQLNSWPFCLNPGGRCKFRTCDPSSVNGALKFARIIGGLRILRGPILSFWWNVCRICCSLGWRLRLTAQKPISYQDHFESNNRTVASQELARLSKHPVFPIEKDKEENCFCSETVDSHL